MMKILILFTLVFLKLGDGARILGVFNHPAKSHTFLGTVLFEELARRGHQVTFVNGYGAKCKLDNYRNILVEGIAEDLVKREMIYFDYKDNQQRIIKESIEMSMVHMAATFQNPELKQMIASNQTFDLVIADFFYNDANLILGYLFKAPVIIVSSFGNTLATTRFTGNELPFSYVPGCSLQLNDNMDFWERLKMTYFGSDLLWTLRDSEYEHFKLMKKYFDNVPSIEELYDNVALVLANSHYSFETVRPSTPNIVSIGGFHVQQPKPLEKDLKKILDEAKHGVIYFSLGSQIKTSNMKNETLRRIIEVFSRIDSLVLWKLEKNNGFSFPKNVIIREWFSQADILAHPNLSVFITHGGTLSMIEALHYGIPMIVIPFNGDQLMNSKFVETRKIGKLINLEDIDRITFSEVVEEVLENPRYRKNAQHYSKLLRKQPMKPMDTALFWIEHVIENKGASHLKPFSMKLSWLEYHLLDVYAVILSVIFIIIFSVLLVVNIVIFVILSKFGYFKKTEKSKQC